MVIGRLFFDKVLREVVVFCKIEKIFFLMKQGFFMGNGPSFLATIKPIKSIVRGPSRRHKDNQSFTCFSSSLQ